MSSETAPSEKSAKSETCRMYWLFTVRMHIEGDRKEESCCLEWSGVWSGLKWCEVEWSGVESEMQWSGEMTNGGKYTKIIRQL